MTDAELSKLLFEAADEIDMLIDIVEARSGRVAEAERATRDRIREYRMQRGWNPDGFGGES